MTALRALTLLFAEILLHPREAARQARAPGRPRMLWKHELVTCVLATWLIEGLTMDAWAHTNQTKLETVVTSWHALFYGGFLVTAGWIFWRIHRNLQAGRTGLDAIPIGYGVGLIGIGCFYMSGVGDQIWHALFGIERDLKAFLSPTHLLLVIGMVLLVSTPYRAMWTDPRPRRTSFVALLPAIWSLALTMLILSLISDYIIIFASDLPTIGRDAFAQQFPGDAPAPLLGVFSARFQVQGVLMLYLTNLLLMMPVLLALRRWRLPFGAITFMWTLVIASDLVAYQYNRGWTLVAVVAGGLVADYLVARLRPSEDDVTMFRLFAALAPAALWTLYFVVLAVAYHIGWPTELGVGVTVIASMTSLILAYVMIPTRVHRLAEGPPAVAAGEVRQAAPSTAELGA